MTKKRVVIKGSEGIRDLVLEFDQMITPAEYTAKYPCRWCKGGPAHCSRTDEESGEEYFECKPCSTKKAKQRYEKYIKLTKAGVHR